MGPLDLELTRQEEAATRQQAQQNTELQQIPESVIKDSTPEQVKPKGKNKLGKLLMDIRSELNGTKKPNLFDVLFKDKKA